ncbi:MAG: hypothetical protein HYY76_08630 [Acidobacteria bacterium]|nr:hypothetical protein [Acidobacteriota bacterium]
MTELQEWATDEAAALVTRSAHARSDTILREVEAVRKAFESAARSIEAALKTPPPPSEEIGGFVERLTAHVGLDAIRTQLQERDAANRRLGELLTQTQAELEAARSELNAERVRAEAARVEAAQVQREFEAALDELRQEHVTVIGEQAVTWTSLPLDELLTVFHALGKATTIPEVLTTLVNGIAREFSRVALFDVHGSGLKGARQVGFDFPNDISKVVIPLSGDSLLARATKTGRLEAFFPGPHSDAAGLIPFGGVPACALAIPIIVQGMTVGVIYADDADRAEFTPGAAQARAKYAELLQRHTVLVLLRIWVEQAARAKAEREQPAPAEPKTAVRTDAGSRTGLRLLALRLADELEREYTAGAEVGRTRQQCQQRLAEGTERARQLYAARVPPGSSDAATLLEEHLATVARARSQTNFGRDLATLIVRYRPVANS